MTKGEIILLRGEDDEIEINIYIITIGFIICNIIIRFNMIGIINVNIIIMSAFDGGLVSSTR